MPSTTPDGLVYPDSTDSTQLWVHYQNLAESVQAKFTNLITWTSWTPTWDTAGNGGFTTDGAGWSEGFYMRIGNLVHAEFRVELGAGFVVDTGTFALYLPVTAYNTWSGSGLQSAIGSWTIRDDSALYHHAGTMGLYASDGLRASFNGAWDSGSSRDRARVKDDEPMNPWQDGDVMSGNLTYRAA